jgi:hypothetical protein
LTDLGIKQVTGENWLEIDPTNGMFGWCPEPADLIAHIMSPQLAATIPKEIRTLFEVARGAMCYGFLFYPLWTLAAEQLFRVGEAAISHRCEQLQAPNKVRTFEDKIDFLKQEGAISADGFDWHTLRRFRNRASHPRDQTIVSPAMACLSVEGLVPAINALLRKLPPQVDTA